MALLRGERRAEYISKPSAFQRESTAKRFAFEVGEMAGGIPLLREELRIHVVFGTGDRVRSHLPSPNSLPSSRASV